jgi:hypothetical protein
MPILTGQEMQIQMLMKEIFKWHCPFNLPGNSAVDSKVDRVNERKIQMLMKEISE